MEIANITNSILGIAKDIFAWIHNFLIGLGDIGAIAELILVVGLAWYIAKNVIGTLLIIILAFLLYLVLNLAGGLI